MKVLIVCTLLMLHGAMPACSAEESIWDKLVNTTLQHIKVNGPDFEVGRFMSMSGRHAWRRRAEFVALVSPHLEGTDPDMAAGALAVFYRLRAYRPLSSPVPLGHQGGFANDNLEFFSELEIVYGQLDRLYGIESDEVCKSLALYLGCSPTVKAKHHLMRIAESPSSNRAKEQALICLAWYRDLNDMEALLPYMLESSQASRALPYHFRNSYGRAC